MKLSWNKLSHRMKSMVYAACLVGLYYAVITHLGSVWSAFRTVLSYFTPVIIGLVLALILAPVANSLQRVLFRRTAPIRTAEIISAVLTILLVILCLALLIGALLPQLGSSVLVLIDNLESYAVGLQQFMVNLGFPSADTEALLTDLVGDSSGLLSRAVPWLTGNIGRVVKVSGNIRRGAFNWGIGSILAIYFLLAKHRLKSGAGKLLHLLLSPGAYRRTADLGRRFDAIFARYILCELLDALIIGTANYIFMKITGMPYAILISVAVGVTNLAPTFGPIIGAAIGAFILLLAQPVLSLWFLVFTIILQTLDGYIIKPKMFGDVLNVPGLLILVSIVTGGRMFGVAGVLLAIPAAAILEYLYQEFFIPCLEARKCRREASHGVMESE